MRSILFVPADRTELVAKASRSEASLICLDLEDGVAPSSKPAARSHVAAAVGAITGAGLPVAIRVNADLDVITHDLEVLPVGLAAVVLPKASTRHQIEQLDEALDRRFGQDAPQIIAMVETAAGLDALAGDTGAWPARLCAFALGTEDLSMDLGCAPDGPPIQHAMNTLAHLAARCGLRLLGYPGSIGEFRDLDRFEAAARAGAACGASGGFAVHPKQVEMLNRVFALSTDAQAEAEQIVAEFEAALKQGKGAIQIDGRMIDRPIYLAAKRRLTA